MNDLLQASAMRAVTMGDGGLNSAMDNVMRQAEDLVNRQPNINGLTATNHTGQYHGEIYFLSCDSTGYMRHFLSCAAACQVL